MKELISIQTELNCPKGQYNSFGKYHYRSCEDILEGLKPLLAKYECYVTITDEIVLVGDRYYVKATARLHKDKEVVEVSAFARESVEKKGMDDSQITGAASSYARKYALNGLFAIDDTKDADTQEKKEEPKKEDTQDDEKPRFNDKDYENLQASIMSGKFEPPASADELLKKVMTKYKVSKANQEKIRALYANKA